MPSSRCRGLVPTATQSNDGRSGGGGVRVLAASLCWGLSLICRSGDTGHRAPWSPPANVSRHPATGHQARLPTATRPLSHLQIVLNCRTQVQRRDYTFITNLFLSFLAIFILFLTSRFAIAIHVCKVMVLLEMKYSYSSDFNYLRVPPLLNCNSFHFLPQKLSNVSVSPLLRLAICCI